MRKRCVIFFVLPSELAGNVTKKTVGWSVNFPFLTDYGSIKER